MSAAYFGHLAQRDDVRTLHIHEQASETIRSMFAQVDSIKHAFGMGAEYVKAVSSLHHCLIALLRIGFSTQAYVTRDVDDIGLSLFVQEGTVFVFGIIWFRDRSYDNTTKAGIAGDWSAHS